MRKVKLRISPIRSVFFWTAVLPCVLWLVPRIARAEELLYKVSRATDDNYNSWSGIGVFPKGDGFIVAHQADNRLVVCKQGKNGHFETVANFHLPEKGEPVRAVPYGDSHVCVMDVKGRLWFFEISLTVGSVKQLAVMRFEKAGGVMGPGPNAYLPKTATIYLCCYPSNEIWTISVKDPGKPVLVQRVAATFPGELPTGEFGSPAEVIVKQIQGPAAMTVSGDGRDLYLLNFTEPSIAQFRISQKDGTLTYSQIYDRTTIKGERRLIPHSIMLPWAIAASVDGKNVYVGGFGDKIGIFSRNLESGALDLLDVVHPKMPGFSSLDYIVSLRATLDGSGLVVTCRNSGSIFVLDREATGKLKVRKEIAGHGNLAFGGLSDAVATQDNDKVLFTSAGVVLAAANAKVEKPKK